MGEEWQSSGADYGWDHPAGKPGRLQRPTGGCGQPDQEHIVHGSCTSATMSQVRKMGGSFGYIQGLPVLSNSPKKSVINLN